MNLNIKNSLKISPAGVYLNGIKIPCCSSVNIKNINPIDPMEATITISVYEIDVDYETIE